MFALAFLALLIEAVMGYPGWMARSVGHPVMWMGRLIGFLDGALNHDSMTNASRKAAGAFSLLIVIGITGGAALVLERGLFRLPFGVVAAALAASALLAQRSLHDHVANVAAALEREGLAAGRKAVSHLVGRDTDELEEA